MSQQQYFAACPKGLENLLEQELAELQGSNIRQTVAGVYFDGDLSTAYRVCLWSRLANKILMPLARFNVDSQEDLYQGVREIAWQDHLSPSGSLLVDFIGTNHTIRNSQFGAVKVKDAIVDCLRDLAGERPSVAKRDPDLRINARLNKGAVVVSLDLTGESLHRRGYRTQQGAAPLKENLAAGLLLRAGWPAIAKAGGALLDPMCGSGTFLVEAAMIAADSAPGIHRQSFGFERWLNHQNDIWLELREEAIARRRHGLAQELPEIRGYDADLRVIRAAESNIASAKLDHWLRVTRKELKDFKKPTHKQISEGLVICNPPYGERLGEVESLKPLYGYLGERLKAEFQGWQAAIFTANPDLGKKMGLRAHKKYKFFNGALASELLLFEVNSRPVAVDSQLDADEPHEERNRPEPGAQSQVQSEAQANIEQTHAVSLTPGAQMLANRLKKNLKQLAKWVKKEGINCYRLYDADMPEYSAAIDLYLDEQGRQWAHVQEYVAPKSIDEDKANIRFQEIELAVPEALAIDRKQVFYKQRRRNRGRQQYEKFHSRTERELLTVREGQVRLQVNLWEYLDTGLFLDHRPVRLMIAEQARGKRFLNLFCYTATASVHAAMAGAKYTVSVDMSHTYLNWARKNYAVNGLGEGKNRLVQANCLEWLQEQSSEQEPQQFDLILLDPPSFSNSKRMEGVLDVQRDHVAMIEDTLKLLAPGGSLFFSNNLRSFKLDAEALSDYRVEDVSRQSRDKDFQRNSKIHQCWLIKHADK